MFQRPCNGSKLFEAAIYNKNVRALVKENRSHAFFEDHWADVHREDLLAQDESEARAKFCERYRPEDGFVIADLYPRSI